MVFRLKAGLQTMEASALPHAPFRNFRKKALGQRRQTNSLITFPPCVTIGTGRPWVFSQWVFGGMPR